MRNEIVGTLAQFIDDAYLLDARHPFPEEEQERFAFEAEDARLQYADYIADSACPICDNTNKNLVDSEGNMIPVGSVGNEVLIREDPYQLEVFAEWTPLISCFACYQETYQDA